MGTSVLVVEDDHIIRETLVEVLEDEGFRACGAANGKEALVRLENADERPCLILLDMMMPVMDGITFREQQLLQPQLAGIPVVVLTADRDLSEVARDLKVNQVLRKPLRLVDLLETVRRLCPADC